MVHRHLRILFCLVTSLFGCVLVLLAILWEAIPQLRNPSNL